MPDLRHSLADDADAVAPKPAGFSQLHITWNERGRMWRGERKERHKGFHRFCNVARSQTLQPLAAGDSHTHAHTLHDKKKYTTAIHAR